MSADQLGETVEQAGKSPEAASYQEPRRPRWGFIISLVIVVVVAAITLVAFFGWAEVYTRKFEPNAPEIAAVEVPRGVGLAPVTVRMDLRDPGAGLDEVVVRTRQRARSREILRQALEGRHAARVAIDFPGEKSDLEEGTVELEIRAFDRSFWSNAATKTFTFKVDFRRPRVEVLSTQHNARHGGTQLIIYRAIDEDLAFSGVKIGEHLFAGFPARGIDKDFSDSSLYGALFAVDLRERETPPMQLYAEDSVGNTAGASFYYKIGSRSMHTRQITLNEDFMRRSVPLLVEQSLSMLEADAASRGVDKVFTTPRGSDQRLVEQFQVMNSRVRSLNDDAITKLLQGPRFERLWDGPLSKPTGSVVFAYGDEVKFNYQGELVAAMRSTGYQLSMPRDSTDVFAAADGVVTFSESFGVPGRVVALDHGMGLSTLYGSLEQATVTRGETVRRGQTIGRAGNTGLVSGASRGSQLYFEVRIHGVPVAPEEWWEAGWFEDHLTGKINEVKQSLGMAVLRPIRR